MKKFSLRAKLIFAFLLAGLIPTLVIGVYSYQKSTESLKNEAIEKLVAVRNIKGEAIKRYFEGIRDQVLTFSHDVMIEKAMLEFNSSFKKVKEETELSNADLIKYKSKLRDYYTNEFGKKYLEENGESIDSVSYLNQLSATEIALQYHYIANNPNPLGSKEVLDQGNDGSTYSKFHQRYHPSIREYLQKFGYYDIFLVDIKSGNIVYSVFKELDYGTSLLTGPYNSTNFAEAFKRARDINDKSSYVLVDYKKYPPSYEAPASFIAAPIWNGSKKVGVAIFQMPIDRLNTIMNQRSGMGETGETYLFGEDKLMRSDSYADSKNFNVISSFKKPKKGTLNSYSVNEVLKGNKGDIVTENYLGNEVISAYSPINILGLKWGLIAEIQTAEAFKPVAALKDALMIIVGISCGVIALFAFFISTKLSNRIRGIAFKLSENAKEVGSSSESISVSSTQLSEAATESASSLQETVTSIDEISSMIQRNADAASSSTQVSTKSSETAMKGKKTVESMIKSINEIAQDNEELKKIVKVISEIEKKTKVINDIVYQTKLLSFNASVEAARAGEHGKGFAVVAEEVGNLAAMSGKAALDITSIIETGVEDVTRIVDKTKHTVENGKEIANECQEALDQILQNVTSVNEMVREIATASSEQSTGVQEVTKAMQQLDQTTHQNTSVAQESSSMAMKLRGQANGLDTSVQDLMEVVTGDRKESHSYTKEKKNDENIFHFKPKKHEKRNEVPLKKAGNFDVVIPDEDDPRFKDL